MAPRGKRPGSRVRSSVRFLSPRLSFPSMHRAAVRLPPTLGTATNAGCSRVLSAHHISDDVDRLQRVAWRSSQGVDRVPAGHRHAAPSQWARSTIVVSARSCALVAVKLRVENAPLRTWTERWWIRADFAARISQLMERCGCAALGSAGQRCASSRAELLQRRSFKSRK